MRNFLRTFDAVDYALLLATLGGLAAVVISLIKNLSVLWVVGGVAYAVIALMFWYLHRLRHTLLGEKKERRWTPWLAGLVVLAVLPYFGWVVFGAEKVPCKFSMRANPTNLQGTEICGYALASTATEGLGGTRERIAFLVLQSRDGEYFYMYLPARYSNSSEDDGAYLGKWLTATGEFREVQYRDEDGRSVALGNAMNFVQYGLPAKPGIWMKYIYPATIVEAPR